jgi:hypothetical protein
VPYELLANIDSIVTWEGELAIRERKTTGRGLSRNYWDQFNPDPQIDTYDLVANHVYADEDGGSPRVLVEVLEVGQGFCRLRRMPIRVPAGRREEWFAELQGVIMEAEKRARDAQEAVCLGEDELVAEQIAFPKNTAACHTSYGSCQFVNVCRLAPEAREDLIKGAFSVVRWDPVKAVSTEEIE